MAVYPISRLLFKPTPPQLASPARSALHCTRRLCFVQFHPSPARLSSLLARQSTRLPRRLSATGNGGASETVEESEAGEEEKRGQEEEAEGEKSTAAASVAQELKEMMEARRKESSSSSDFWTGVAEEVSEIEWPPFGKVLGTTGVVLAVIAGSSVALLTVNAILAEISDRVFAGKGIQDFF